MAATTFRSKLGFPYLSISETHRLDFGTYTMFSGSMNPIKTIMITLGHYFGRLFWLPSWISQWPPPEKNNHKLNFFYKLIWSYWTNYQNSPNFRPLYIRLKNTFQNGRHPVRAKFGFANMSVLETHRNLILVGVWTEIGFAYN